MCTFHLSAMHKHIQLPRFERFFFRAAMRLWWCGRHSTICDLGNENAFYYYFCSFFSPPLVYTLYAVHILWHRHTNAQPSFFASRFAPKKKTHSNQINSCVTCINITPNEFSLQRAKLKTHKKSLLFEMDQGGESYSHVFRFLDSLWQEDHFYKVCYKFIDVI